MCLSKMQRKQASLLLKKDKMQEIEIEINNEGVMLINRQDDTHNALLLSLMREIGASNIEELECFLKENEVELLFGDEILCG